MKRVSYAFGATTKSKCKCGKLLNGKTVTWTDEIHPHDYCDVCNRKESYMKQVTVLGQDKVLRPLDRKLRGLAIKFGGRFNGAGTYLPTLERDMSFEFKSKGAGDFAKAVRSAYGKDGIKAFI